MDESFQQDYSHYLEEYDRRNKQGRPLGPAAFLLLREKLDELTLLELQEGFLQGLDKESRESLSFLSQELLEEGPQCFPARDGEDLLTALLEGEFLENQVDPEEMDSVQDLFEDGYADLEWEFEESPERDFVSPQGRIPASRTRRERWRSKRRRQGD